MIADTNGEPGSQQNSSRLPSLMALRCFATAARTQNFSQAADSLHLTHGAVSRAVRMLEDDLGLALFERRNRGVFLTEAGRRLQRAVDEGFGLIEEATRELRHSARETPLVLSCEPTLLMRWLIPRWPDFQARHPEAAVHLVAGGGPFSFDGGIDLAIRRNDFAWPASVHAQPLFEEKIGPVCSPGRVDAFFDTAGAGPSLRSDAVRLHTRTRPQAWPSWTRLRGASAGAGGREQVFEHFYFSLQAAVAGLGVAIGPWHLVCDDLESGVLAAPLGFVADGSGYFLLSPQKPAAGRQRQLLDWLLSVV
ncbi:LysR family transcriptional regulator [Variovorax sp.]|uniref:LysR family transcriptional regulator n=1 Tax=Variovorax sp. TaxID=1871043 RepID=UPI000C5FC014|nr:LysR family transcriptional regulator [Variovorax sp.]MBS79263.1 LysR family transcriptional regulator [Variovorax sp.]